MSSPNPSQGEVPEAAVVELAKSLDGLAVARPSWVGYRQQLPRLKAALRAALPAIRSQIDKEWEKQLKGEAGEIERWMLDAETGDCEPIEAVLLPKGPTADLPANGTQLVRLGDHLGRLKEVERQRNVAESRVVRILRERSSVKAVEAAEGRAEKAEAALAEREQQAKEQVEADAYDLASAADEIEGLDQTKLQDWVALLFALEAKGWRIVKETGRDQCDRKDQTPPSGPGPQSSPPSSSPPAPRPGSSSPSCSGSSSPRSSGSTGPEPQPPADPEVPGVTGHEIEPVDDELVADPEVPRCGGSGWIKKNEPSLPSGIGGSSPCPGCPDCHSTPELLGEEGLWRCPKHGVLQPEKLAHNWGEGEPGEYGHCPVMEDEDTGCGRKLERVVRGGHVFDLPSNVWMQVSAPLLSDETIRELTKQIVEGSDGEVISLPYEVVKDALADVLRQLLRSTQPVSESPGKGDILDAIHETALEVLREPRTQWPFALWDRLFPGEKWEDAIRAAAEAEPERGWSVPESPGNSGEGDQRVVFEFHPECLEAENVREFHPEIVGAATGALLTMLDPEKDERAHRDADLLASCAVSEALKALVTVADLTQPVPGNSASLITPSSEPGNSSEVSQSGNSGGVEEGSHEERMEALRGKQAELIAEIRSHLTDEENAQVSDKLIWQRGVEHGPTTPEGHADGIRQALAAADEYGNDLAAALGLDAASTQPPSPQACPSCRSATPFKLLGECAGDGHGSNPWHVESIEALGRECEECERGIYREGSEWVPCQNCFPEAYPSSPQAEVQEGRVQTLGEGRCPSFNAGPFRCELAEGHDGDHLCITPRRTMRWSNGTGKQAPAEPQNSADLAEVQNPEPQGDVVERLAKALWECRNEIARPCKPKWEDAADKLGDLSTAKGSYRDLARQVLADITPLIHLDVKERLVEVVDAVAAAWPIVCDGTPDEVAPVRAAMQNARAALAPVSSEPEEGKDV